MVGFSGNYRPVTPSELGETFEVNCHVAFLVNGTRQTGIITKQLKNAAVVEVDPTASNVSYRFHKNGVVVVNYKQLKKI